MHDGLLETLEYAATRIPYYRRTLGARWRRGLSALPVLTKAQAIAHQAELVLPGLAPFTGIVSSGTSVREGPVLRVPRLPQEREAQRALLARHPATAPRRVLEVHAAHHGLDRPAPLDDRVRVPWTYSTTALRAVERALFAPRGAPVTHLAINAGALMPLTIALQRKGRALRRLRLASISTTGFRLSPHWRAVVEQAWGARTYDNYSLSELPAPALECDACGFNHFLPPPMVAELVDPLTFAPVGQGPGVLVLTTLFPFVQAMPLIRYWTGDLAQRGPVCAATKTRGFRVLGRRTQSLITRAGVLVAAQHVTDALEPEPLVARHLHPLERLGLVPHADCGAVKSEVAMTRSGPRVRVELKFEPSAHGRTAQALGERIAARLLAASPALRRLERSRRGELEVNLVPPGTLEDRWSKW